NAEGEVVVAAILVFLGTNGTALSQLSEHLRLFPEGARFLAAALGWLDWDQARPGVERLLASPEPLLRANGQAASG
ncbi:hypothetical protein V9P83_31815, partial [Pseudomonas aeruginosa]